MTGSKHHFVPKLYLKWFGRGKSPTKSLYCIDKALGTLSEQSIKKVATSEDFNTVDLPNVNPQHFEQRYDSEFESPVAPVLHRIWKNRSLPGRDTDAFAHLIGLVALLYVRNPSTRDPYVDTLNRALVKRQSLQNQLDIEKRLGIRRTPLPNFTRGGAISPDSLDPSRSAQVVREHGVLAELRNILYQRDWRLITVREDADYFVTSDRPVIVAPRTLNSLNTPIGLGTRETRLLLPLNSRCLLVGGLDLEVQDLEVGNSDLRVYNTLTFLTARRMVYSPTKDFQIVRDDGTISDATTMLKAS